MAALFSAPKPQVIEVPVYTSQPLTSTSSTSSSGSAAGNSGSASSSDSSSGTTASTSATTDTPSKTRGIAGTVQTSWRGLVAGETSPRVLDSNDSLPIRKSLLGE